MSFFHNLNKTLDSIAARPESAQLNERDMGKHNNATTGFKAVADKAAKEYGSKAAGERVAGAQFQKMKKAGQLEEEGMSRAAKGYEKYGKEGMEALAKAGRDDASANTMDAIRNRYNKYDNTEVDESQGMTDEGNAFSKAVVDAKKDGIQPGEKIRVGGKQYPVRETEMTPKQKSFAALAPPKDKITFADKIAGAKKEVDEMLGDVAAEAMRSALGGGKGRNAEMDEASDDNAFTAHKRARAETPKVGTITHGSKHDVEEIPGGRRVTRRTDAQGISVGADDGQSSSDAPRGRGRPKGPAKAPERVTGGATRHKGGRKMTKEGGGMMKHTFAILDDTLIDQIANMNGAEVDPDAGSVETYDENTARQLIAFAQKNPQRLKRTQTMNTAGMRPMAQHSGGSGAGPEYNLKEVGDVDIADQGEYDQEGDMAKDSIKTVVRHAQALEKILGDNDNLPEWVQSKLAKIESMMTAVDDYMQNQETDQDDEMAMGEEKTSTRDRRAERAGKKVTKDIEYDEKKKDGIHGKKRSSEDNKADKAGKKVTKDIEHDEKEDDEKEDKPKKSKSKFKFGGSVYEHLDAQLETLINESMNISVNMATTDDGQQDSNSITVTASGEDAMTLAQLLKSAGLSQSSHGGCSTCGQSSCGCEQVDENSPDYPTNTETSDNAFQYSGGLNKPKSTGQTTTPVLASQLRRQVSMEESVKIERNLFDLYKNFAK
jgi:hypothetical protein